MTTGLTEAPLLTARGLSVGHEGRALLPPVELSLRAGELWALIGHNGGGKTTLLRTLLGSLPRLGGELSRAPGPVGYVPQRSELDATVPMRVLDLVRGGADVGWSFLDPLGLRRRAAAIERAMADTELHGLADRPYGSLSEGQKQRVLLARALASEPRLLVLDEPTSAMDLAAERAVFELLERLRRARSLGVIVVGHHVALLLAYATHALLVDKDDALVLGGPVASLTSDPRFQARYVAPGLVPAQPSVVNAAAATRPAQGA